MCSSGHESMGVPGTKFYAAKLRRMAIWKFCSGHGKTVHRGMSWSCAAVLRDEDNYIYSGGHASTAVPFMRTFARKPLRVDTCVSFNGRARTAVHGMKTPVVGQLHEDTW